MAEVAAGAIVYETVETAAQIGVGAYMVSKPTMPLKATFKQIATSSDDETRLSLSRSGHTLSIVKNKAYIFGGETAAGKLAGNEIHAVTVQPSDTAEPDYSVIPAIADVGDSVPSARKAHAACSFNICVAIFGGVNDTGEVIDETILWLFNVGKSAWETLQPESSERVPQARRDAHLFNHNNNLVLYGGTSARGEALRDVWYYSYVDKAWTQLPDAPVSTSSIALSDGTLCAISSTDNLSGDLYTMPVTTKSDEEQSWSHVPFPANPLTPGPLPRIGAGMIPITTGYGRQYLLYMFGSSKSSQSSSTDTSEASEAEVTSKDRIPDLLSDIWTYQMPSSTLVAKPTTNVYDALKPAKIKDAIRGALGMDDGKHSWGEVEVLPPTDLPMTDGKVHPGPRAFFAGDVMKDGRTVVFWGGVNPKGDREGDGWTIRLE